MIKGALLALLMLLAAPALAQGGPSPFARPGAPVEAAVPPGGFMAWVQDTQRDYRHRLAAAVKAVRGADPLAALLALCGIAFVYGVLHALGPGHGKAVISTYVLTGEGRLPRVLLVSALSSLAQAVSAVTLVYGVLFVAEQTTRGLTGSARALEAFADGLVVLVGVYLLVRARRAWKAAVPPAAPEWRVWRNGLKALPHEHGPTCGCGHHHPTPEDLDRATDWRAALGVVAAVGLRPCSGAILVLVFAYGMELHLTGVAATFAMATGTGLTVAAIAVLAWAGRRTGQALATRRGLSLARLGAAVSAIGGLLILGMGGLLLLGTLTSPPPPF